jgi:hypothetical protein
MGCCALRSAAFREGARLDFIQSRHLQSSDPTGTPFQSYMSNTEVKPPQLQINKNSSGLAPGLVFVGVDGKPTSGQNWPTIFGECFHIEEFLNLDVLIAEPKTD